MQSLKAGLLIESALFTSHSETPFFLIFSLSVQIKKSNRLFGRSRSEKARGEMVDRNNRRTSVLQDLAVGLLISGVVKLTLAPAERVKILLQTQSGNPRVISGELTAYADGWDCFFRVIEEQGFRALYRGAFISAIRYLPQQATSLLVNDRIMAIFPRYDPRTDFWKSFAVRTISGAVAGSINSLICAPFDLARTRLASDMAPGPAQFRGLFDLSWTILWQHGMTGFFTGATSAIAGAFVYRIGQLACFRQIQDLNPYSRDPGTLGAVSSFLAVILARTLVEPCIYPFDTIRRQMFAEAELVDPLKKYHGSVDCAFQIIQRNGVSGLFAGFGEELFRGIGMSLVIVAYDRIKSALLST